MASGNLSFADGLPEAVAVSGNAGLHGPAKALPQMKPVGDLRSTGRTAPGASA